VGSDGVYPVERVGARLKLREFTERDADAVLAIYGDPVATEHLRFEPHDRAGVDRFLKTVTHAALIEARTEFTLAIERLDTGELVGVARLATERDDAGQIGFALRSDQWRQGLGTETVGLLLQFGFECLQLHRIWAAHSPLNAAAEALLRRAGFIGEGRIRHHIRKAGAWRDSIFCSILEHEWRDSATVVPASCERTR
jgi:[ribosomal protein S5]-alanine N-acetyltransferase